MPSKPRHSCRATDHFVPIITVALPLASFALALLCLLSGKSANFLENFAVLTIDTSKLKSVNPSQLGGTLLGGLKLSASGLPHDVGSTIAHGTDSIPQVPSVADFYSLHLLNFCEGDFKNAANVAGQSREAKKCSKAMVGYDFDTSAGSSGRDTNIATLLNKLGYASAQASLHRLGMVMKVVSSLYVLGACGLGFQTLFAPIAIFYKTRKLWRLNLVYNLCVGALVLTCSSLSTTIAFEAKRSINNHDQEVPISIAVGHPFVGLTWTMTGLLLATSVVWFLGKQSLIRQ